MNVFCGNESMHCSHEHIDPAIFATDGARTYCQGWPDARTEMIAQAIAEAVDGMTIDEWHSSSVDYRLEFISGAYAALSFCPAN